ncbi:MAG: hypothetical protein KKA81_01895 [Bacteroidetes bacterium]|nr:hypothetical protein [Bacteroidota bacterium]
MLLGIQFALTEDRRSRKQGAGSRLQDAGSRLQDAGSWRQDAGSRRQEHTDWTIAEIKDLRSYLRSSRACPDEGRVCSSIFDPLVCSLIYWFVFISFSVHSFSR